MTGAFKRLFLFEYFQYLYCKSTRQKLNCKVGDKRNIRVASVDKEDKFTIQMN
jgi:hypothetical protein